MSQSVNNVFYVWQSSKDTTKEHSGKICVITEAITKIIEYRRMAKLTVLYFNNTIVII